MILWIIGALLFLATIVIIIVMSNRFSNKEDAKKVRRIIIISYVCLTISVGIVQLGIEQWEAAPAKKNLSFDWQVCTIQKEELFLKNYKTTAEKELVKSIVTEANTLISYKSYNNTVVIRVEKDGEISEISFPAKDYKELKEYVILQK